MATITYAKLANNHFDETSLNTFIRHQEITEIWQKIDGKLVLQPIHFVEEWEQPILQQLAHTILNIIKIGSLGGVAGCVSFASGNAENHSLRSFSFPHATRWL